jgi:ribosome biogenesis GTPase
MRELGLVGEGDGLDEVFADVQDLVAGCRFRDCHHQGEPGCAVEAALRRGVLDADRWASYQKLQREAAFESQRHDEAAQRLAARALQKRFTEKIGRERDRRRLGWKA